MKAGKISAYLPFPFAVCNGRPCKVISLGVTPDSLTETVLSVKFNKLTSVFHASVLLLIMNFVITLSK